MTAGVAVQPSTVGILVQPTVAPEGDDTSCMHDI